MSRYEIIPISPAMMELLEQQSEAAIDRHLSREILLLDVKLAGAHFTPEMAETVRGLSEGTLLRLVRTPSGDDLEISVFYGENRLGVIPMEQNVVIARLMDAGKMLVCRVESASIEHNFMSRTPWVRILVKIYLVD